MADGGVWGIQGQVTVGAKALVSTRPQNREVSERRVTQRDSGLGGREMGKDRISCDLAWGGEGLSFLPWKTPSPSERRGRALRPSTGRKRS